jgi:hypothetical protein
MKLLTLLTLNGNTKSSTNDNALLLLLDMMKNLAKNSSPVKTTQNSNALYMMLDLIKNISPDHVPKSTPSTATNNNNFASLLELFQTLTPQQQQTIEKQRLEPFLDLLKNLSSQQHQSTGEQKAELLHSILQLSHDINTGSNVVKGGNNDDAELYINDSNYIKIRKFANDFDKYSERILYIKSEFDSINDGKKNALVTTPGTPGTPETPAAATATATPAAKTAARASSGPKARANCQGWSGHS